jgi:hypothetical protein
MLLIEKISAVLPNERSGKIVGIATYRGEYCLVACEYGLYRVWDDGTGEIAATAVAKPPV